MECLDGQAESGMNWFHIVNSATQKACTVHSGTLVKYVTL